MSTLDIVYTTKSLNTFKFKIDIKKFPGGEINVCLPDDFDSLELLSMRRVEINCRISDSDGIMALALLRNAIANTEMFCPVNLNLGYIPYGRQDRVCNPGEAFSCKVFSAFLNTLMFNKISTLDPHSHVSTCNLNTQVYVNTQQDMLVRFNGLMKHYPKNETRELVFVSPDAGAKQKTIDAAKALGINEIIQGSKIRDPKTGNLTGFAYEGDVKDKHLLIVDDICDGGGTFVGLVKELQKGNPYQIDLYVSHGIFSKGLDILFDNGISNIYTTDTILHGLMHSRLHTAKWY